jgi:uncharacterized membrane protein YvbJ
MPSKSESKPKKTEPTADPTLKKSIPRSLIILVSVIAGFAAIVGGLLWFTTAVTKNATQVSDQVISAVQTNDPKKVYELSSDTFRASTSEEQLVEIMNSVSPAFQGTARITTRSIQKNANGTQQAIIIYTVDTRSGKKYIRVVLQKKGSSWKVVNFRTSDKVLDTSSTH